MSKCKRATEIINTLLQEHFVSAESLRQQLGVSIATVRRDIDILESEGIITKIHGGILLRENETTSAISNPFFQIERIGAKAASLVEENDAIFIGPGKACVSFAKNLRDKKRLLVVTNSLSIVQVFSNSPGIQVISCGGDVQSNDQELFTSGQCAMSTIENIYINKVFITVDAISQDHGCYINHYELTLFYRKLLQNSYTNIVLVDSSRLGKRAFHLLCPIGMIQTFVTNGDVPKSFVRYTKDNRINLILT